MADFYVPMTVVLTIKDIDPDDLDQYIDDAIFGLTEAFYSSDAEDDHFEIYSNKVHWNEIQEG